MTATTFTFAPIDRDNGFRQPDHWVWCPSIIDGPDGRWHLFASRWPKWLPFHPGWMVRSEVVRAVADRPEGPYTFAEVVLPARGAGYWDGRSAHNPTIRFHGGRYYLFYMGSTHPLRELRPGDTLAVQDPHCIVARSMKRIGVAWAASLEGPWHRLDTPLLPTVPGTFRSFLTSNPAPWIHDDGRVTLLFKARAYEGNAHGPMTIGLATADTPLGAYTVADDRPLFGPDCFGEVEDPFLWWQEGEFQLIAKDMTGRLCGQHGGGIHAVSADARTWRLGEPATAYRRELVWVDGTRQPVGSLERPFLSFEHGRPAYLCAAVSNGKHGFSDATETWNVVLPLAGGRASGV